MSGLTRPIIILLAGLLVAALLVVPVASPPGSTARALEVTGPLSVVRSAPPDMSAGCPPWFPASFIGLVIGVILIIGGLTFFPAISLGPIVEQLSHGKFF